MSRRKRGASEVVPRWVEPSAEGTGPDATRTLDDWDSAGTVGGSTRAQAAASSALRYALWGGLALAIVLGLLNFATPPGAAPPAAVTTEDATPVPPPGGCAELVVAAWLAGDLEQLAGVPGLPRSRVEPARREALQTYTATVTPGEVGWGYVVGAEVRVREDEDSPWRNAGHQFFAVTMIPAAAGGCQGWAPAALPAQVASPVLGGAELAYPVSLSATGTELSETLQSFFAGVLTGSGNPERYAAPGAEVPVLSPPPYAEVQVTELRTLADPPVERGSEIAPEGTVMGLLVTVATGEDDLPLVYPVSVGVRGGRWEVLAIEDLVGAAPTGWTDTATTPTPTAPSTPNGD